MLWVSSMSTLYSGFFVFLLLIEEYWEIIVDFVVFLTVLKFFSSNCVSVFVCLFVLCLHARPEVGLGYHPLSLCNLLLTWVLSLYVHLAVCTSLTCQDLPFSVHEFCSCRYMSLSPPQPSLSTGILNLGLQFIQLSNTFTHCCSRHR